MDESPADAYVADFLGAANLLDITVAERVPDSASTVKLGEISLTTSVPVPVAPSTTRKPRCGCRAG